MPKQRKMHRSKKNILRRGISSITNASRRVIPGLVSGIGNVGNRVIGTAKKTIPKSQGTIRNFFGMFSLKSTGSKKGSKGSKGIKRKTRRTRRKR